MRVAQGPEKEGKAGSVGMGGEARLPGHGGTIPGRVHGFGAPETGPGGAARASLGQITAFRQSHANSDSERSGRRPSFMRS